MKLFFKYTTSGLVGLFLLVLAVMPTELDAQRLAYESQMEIVLSDGTNITLYKVRGGSKYYYLPPPSSIRLPVNSENVPEFMFAKYTTDERVEKGGTQGALLHFLIQWGLTPDQVEDLEGKLKDKKGPRAKLAGPVDLQAVEGESFRIVSAVLQEKSMTSTLVTSGMAPPMPGGKAAVAARLDKNGAQLLEETFKKGRSISDVSVVLDYEYTVLVKAAKGKLEYNLEVTHEMGDGIAYDLIKKELDKEPELYDAAIEYYEKNKDKMTDECGVGDGMTNVLIGLQAIDNVAGNTSGSGDTGNPWEYGVSENMLRKMYDHFESEEMIKMSWEETLDDERLKVMRDAFFNFFLNAFTEPAYPELSTMSGLQNDVSIGDESIKNSAQGGYKFKSCTKLNASRTLKKTIRLDNITLPVRRRYQMVANLGSVYDEVRSKCKKCVFSVRLDDPFFDHRDINFIIDVEAMDIFQEEINYVTVNVKKQRPGNDFEDAVTLSPEVMRDKGRLATISYARDASKNSGTYEYKVQWSLRGGKLYPENPGYEPGDWQAVTLQCPIKPRTIEFEADLEEMRELDITRATLQVRYMKYGQETHTNIPLTVSRNEPLVTKRIFTDRETTGYAYRFVLNHKTKGKLATEWDPKVNDDYVYAVIPEKLRDEDSEWLKKAKKAAEVLLEPGPGGEVKEGDQVLDRFKDVLKIFLED